MKRLSETTTTNFLDTFLLPRGFNKTQFPSELYSKFDRPFHASFKGLMKVNKQQTSTNE